MRRQHDVGHCGQLGGDLWLVFVNVKAGSAIFFSLSALTSAASSTTGPREVLIKKADCFISENSRSLIKCRVSVEAADAGKQNRPRPADRRSCDKPAPSFASSSAASRADRVDNPHVKAACARANAGQCGRNRPGRVSCRSPPRRQIIGLRPGKDPGPKQPVAQRMLRATASNRPKPRSAVASVTIAGMLVPECRAVAAAMSMRSGVIFIDDTA